MAEYAALWDEEHQSGAKIFFVDEAHFRADAELGGKWELKGREPALVDSTSPRYGEKASYCSAVCLETGEVEWMDLEGNSNAGNSAAFLDRLRQGHSLRAVAVIWDNAPAHRGEAVREYLRAPGLGLRLIVPDLPGYSPDFNGDEGIWGWVREEATGNLCLGTRAAVQERVKRTARTFRSVQRAGDVQDPAGVSKRNSRKRATWGWMNTRPVPGGQASPVGRGFPDDFAARLAFGKKMPLHPNIYKGTGWCVKCCPATTGSRPHRVSLRWLEDVQPSATKGR